jgi:hypothetical protein
VAARSNIQRRGAKVPTTDTHRFNPAVERWKEGARYIQPP